MTGFGGSTSPAEWRFHWLALAAITALLRSGAGWAARGSGGECYCRRLVRANATGRAVASR